jgi:hypothetical protein
MAGFDGMVINRVHQKTKEEFRNNQNLEFVWRQEWEHPLGNNRYVIGDSSEEIKTTSCVISFV